MKFTKKILFVLYLSGLFGMIIWSKNNYYVATLTNKTSYAENKNLYNETLAPAIIMYAIKYETFINSNTDISHFFNKLDEEYKNYNNINFLKMYNSLLRLNKKEISKDTFFIQLENAKKFHRYSDSFAHIAMQAYANNGDLNKFSTTLEDYFYKNLKYSLPFHIKRENITLTIVKSSYSGIGVDVDGKKILIQFSEVDANLILANTLEDFSCSHAEKVILRDMSSRFKLFYSSSVSIKVQRDVANSINKTFAQLSVLCGPRSFIF